MNILDALLDGNTKLMPQGSEEWDEIRLGRFTSSRIGELCECGSRDMTADELAKRPKTGKGSKTTKILDPSIMSEKGTKYINEKVAEALTGTQKFSSYAYPLVYGKETEPLAADYFAQKYSVELHEIGFQCFGEHAGGSPDRIFEHNGIKMGLEIKCPANSDNQIQYLNLVDVWDLKAHYPIYYWQCVSNMLFMDYPIWHFVTYDPRFKDDKFKMSHIVLDSKLDLIKDDFNVLIKVLESAIALKLKIINQLKNSNETKKL